MNVALLNRTNSLLATIESTTNEASEHLREALTQAAALSESVRRGEEAVRRGRAAMAALRELEAEA